MITKLYSESLCYLQLAVYSADLPEQVKTELYKMLVDWYNELYNHKKPVVIMNADQKMTAEEFLKETMPDEFLFKKD